MDAPIPVDMNKLKNILGNAKKVMAKVEETAPLHGKNKRVSEDYGYSQTSSPIYDPNDEREPIYQTPTLDDYQPTGPKTYTAEQVMASNLPASVKAAMIKTPIPQLTMPPSSFTLEDIGDLNDKPKKRSQITENKGNHSSNGYITVSESQLDELVEKKVNEVLSKMFVKTLNEQTIKRTLNLLISEGRLITKKKGG